VFNGGGVKSGMNKCGTVTAKSSGEVNNRANAAVGNYVGVKCREERVTGRFKAVSGEIPILALPTAGPPGG
jgi:hypothetical protein